MTHLTRLDRLVGWFSPEAALRRASARRVLAYYEAAKPTRERKNRRSTGSANDEVLRAGRTLRQIARHLEENYDLALGVLNTLVVNVIGDTGIGVEPQPRRLDGSIHDVLARQIMELHKEWQKKPDVTWQYDWPQAERLLARTWFRDGEALAQVVAGTVSGLSHGGKVPFSVELLEADLLPMDMNASAPARVVQGVELNAWGRPVAYHVFKQDPAESIRLMRATDTKRVPADRMLHIKAAHRIRQVRGVSIFATVLNRFDDLKDYEESERIAAKVAASMAAYIRKGTPDLYDPNADSDKRQMRFRPGMVFDDLRPGEDIGTIDTNRPNPNLEHYRSGQLRAIAAGTGPTFSSISRSYDNTYSAQRQELIEGYAAYQVLAADFISRISRPVYERFVQTAVASGVIRLPSDVRMDTVSDATYMPPAMPWIDPLKEAKAWGVLEDRTYVSGPEIIRKRGGTPMDVLEQQGRWMREKQAEGVPYNAGSALDRDREPAVSDELDARRE